ncbi:hypothetical protein EDD21DRAFT_393105 [Dissophora ornata]|nr:hypothetical protein EDD21DRAFT_393105 [Dissophora ornata]
MQSTFNNVFLSVGQVDFLLSSLVPPLGSVHVTYPACLTPLDKFLIFLRVFYFPFFWIFHRLH